MLVLSTGGGVSDHRRQDRGDDHRYPGRSGQAGDRGAGRRLWSIARSLSQDRGFRRSRTIADQASRRSCRNSRNISVYPYVAVVMMR